jgi:PAS domain S-box-containing protein
MTRVPSILVVEDNPMTRKMLRLALVTEGYAVVEAADARAALAAAAQTLPDLVLQDLILPDMDGLELLRRLRALPGGMELPVLALSGFLSRLEEAQTDKDGFTALLVKPIEPSRLIDAIRVYLPHRPGPAASSEKGQRLLIVDDDPVQLKLTRIHFSHLGFEVSVAGGAVDALAAARANRTEVILSDAFMPGTDGFDLCLAVRRDPSLASVPVVLLSAQYGSRADEDLATRVGASALVVRTPDFANVVSAILQALQTRAPAAAEQPNDQLALTHARLVIYQLERQAAATAGLALRCGIQAGQLSLLSGVADALTRKSDPDVALRDVLAATLDAAGISKGALVLKTESGALELRQDIGFSESERSKLQNFFGQGALLDHIVNTGGSLSVPSPAIPDDTSQDILAGANIAAAQIVPLISDGRGVGAMIIGATGTDVTSDDSVAFARAMGNQVVQSLELARSVARLTASEQRYRTLLDTASDLIAVLSSEGIVREVNQRWVELTGLSQEQLIGRHIRQFAPAGNQDRAVQTYNEAVLTNAVRTTPVEILRSNGSVAFIEFSTTNVDVAGERLVFTVGREVTERRHAEAQLRLQGAALNAAANAMAITDRNGIVQWVNPAFSDLTGYTATEAVGRNPRDLVKSDAHDQAFYKQLWDTILSGEVWRGEMINRRKDGSLYAEEQTITPLRDPSGEISHFIDVKQDITGRKRAEEEIRKSAELSAQAEREFRALFAANPLPMWIYDLGTLRFLAVNDAAVERYGYSSDEFLSMRIMDIRPAQEVERLLTDLSEPRQPWKSAGIWQHRLKVRSDHRRGHHLAHDHICRRVRVAGRRAGYHRTQTRRRGDQTARATIGAECSRWAGPGQQRHPCPRSAAMRRSGRHAPGGADDRRAPPGLCAHGSRDARPERPRRSEARDGRVSEHAHSRGVDARRRSLCAAGYCRRRRGVRPQRLGQGGARARVARRRGGTDVPHSSDL